MDVIFKDFKPFNTWELDRQSGSYWSDGSPKYLIDKSTDRQYFNESKGIVRHKCFLLTFWTPIVHSIASVFNVAYRLMKLVTFSHFLMDKPEEKSYDFKARALDAGKDLLRIVTQPLAIIGLELAAIYGIFMPYDGRKLYASIERVQYGNFILAPCFQPNPERHLLGGDISEKDVF